MFRRTQDPLWRESHFNYRAFYRLWWAFPDRFIYNFSFVTPYRVSYNPKQQASWFGLFPFRSPLLRKSIFFLFLQVLRCFSSLGLPSCHAMYSRKDTIRLKIVGSPIRKSLDPRLAYSSPKHIGVSPVLLRLLVPRHPPCALSNLTNLLLRSKGCFSDFPYQR